MSNGTFSGYATDGPIQSASMRVPIAAALLSLSVTLLSAQPQNTPACTTAAECRAAALDAIEREDFETAHTLAWRVAQLSPKNDAESMRLLARTQSLSGRPHDALVMLQRLTTMKVNVEDAVTSDDYRRVRDLTGWPSLLALIEGTPPAPTVAAPPTPAVPTAVAPVAPPPTAPAPASAPPDDALPVPESLGSIVALAHDAVSRRFVIADDRGDTIKIVDETSGNAMNLVNTGWAGGEHPTALAIDTRRGDLWVATARALHRVQLVSGRALQSVTAPADAGDVKFVAIAIGPGAVFALDGPGSRIYTFKAGDTSMRIHATLEKLTGSASLAAAPDGHLYLAHTAGLVRIGGSALRPAAVTAARGVDLSRLQSLTWDRGALIGTRETTGAMSIVRLSLDSRGTRVRSVKTLRPAHAAAMTVSGGALYYVATEANGRAIIGRQPPR